MANHVQQLGDNTSKDTVPDFESARGYYWMQQMKEIQNHGTPVKNWPRKPRRTQAERSYFSQVDRRLSRSNFSVNIRFGPDGKRIHG
jgi:hypothetical protein